MLFICDAKFGTLYLRDADAYRAVAIHNAPPAYVEARKRDLVRPPPDSALGQIAKTCKVAHVADITAVKSYIERFVSSLSSRVFSIAITACAAKFVSSAICLSVNSCTAWRHIVIAPISSLSLSIGTATIVR